MADLLYQLIVDHLKQAIENGEYKEYDKLPTEAELSQQFSVSRITSKKALDTLAAEGLVVRRRRIGTYVAPAADSANKFTVNESEVSPFGGGLITFLMPINSEQSDFSEYTSGILSVLDSTNYHLVVHNSNKSSYNEKEVLSTLTGNGVSGIILYPFSDVCNFDILSSIYWNHLPMVTIDKRYADLPIPSVSVDDCEASYRMTKYLIAKGHKHIAFMTEFTIDSASSLRDRLTGYCRALSENKIKIDRRSIINVSSLSLENNRSMTSEMLTSLLNMNITAVQCATDGVALWLIHACTTNKISIPDDLSIVGFDDLPESSLPANNLTTIKQDYRKIGEKAAQVLLAQIEERSYDMRSICPSTFIERGSVKDLNNP